MTKSVVVLGAGPAGLMAAWDLTHAGYEVTLLEKELMVGGMCATLSYQNKGETYRFDYGSHLFSSDNTKLKNLFDKLLGDELLHVDKKSVIHHKGKVYQFPLAFGNVVKNASFKLMLGSGFDLLASPFRKKSEAGSQTSFAQWIRSRFGNTLYQQFFKQYSHKLWGIPPEQLSSDWGSQHIGFTNLKTLAASLLKKQNTPPSNRFHKPRYPKYGFGYVFERIEHELVRKGVQVIKGANVSELVHDKGKISQVLYRHNNNTQSVMADYIISTLPLNITCEMLGHDSELEYRSVRYLNMPVAMDNVSENAWQFLSDDNMLATRINEPKRRSSYMAPPGKTSIMLEIPCNKGDEIWSMDKTELFEKAKGDLDALGIDSNKVGSLYFDAYSEYAYPLMDINYQEKRQGSFDALHKYDNLILAGRQATFRYVEAETAMEMGMMAAQGIIDGKDNRAEIFDHRA